jgi:hypothetical protein
MNRAIIAVVVLLALGTAREAAAALVPVNSNSKVEYGIEYYIQTDKAVYDLGENVQLLFQITNFTDELWTRVGPCTIANFYIEDLGAEEAELVWAHPYASSTRPARISLEPGETYELSRTWPQ